MIAFIYRMRIKPGHEAAYDAAWREATLVARDQFNSCGSHLFTSPDGTRVAVALWPDHESRERFFAWRRANPTPLSEVMREAVEQSFEPEVLESLDDLWVR